MSATPILYLNQQKVVAPTVIPTGFKANVSSH